MNLNDTARVLHPHDEVEYGLGTVAGITYAPSSTHVTRYRLRFPTSDERTFAADEITACTRADDQDALVVALIGACRCLRDACRIAHDFDEKLSTDILCMLIVLHGTARARLDVTLGPASLDDPAATDDDGEAARP